MCNKHSDTKSCGRCGSEFTPTPGFANFCSHKCKYNTRPVSREAVNKRAEKLRKVVKSTCRNPECQKDIFDKPSANRIYCSPSCASKVRMNKPETKLACRERAYTQGFGGNKCRGVHGYYDSPFAGRVYLESSYEIAVAKELDANGINWQRPSKKESMTYQLPDEDRERRYEPDFFLPDYNVYLDPKNAYRTKKDKRKIRLVRQRYKDTRILLLNEDELTWNTIAVKIGLDDSMSIMQKFIMAPKEKVLKKQANV